MDFMAIINVLRDVPTEKIITIFCLVILGVVIYNTVMGNTKAIKGLTNAFQLFSTNLALHDQKAQYIKEDLKEVRSEVNIVKQDVSGIKNEVHNIRNNMVTRDELQDVSRTVSMLGRREGDL